MRSASADPIVLSGSATAPGREAVPTGPGGLADRSATMAIDAVGTLVVDALDDCPPARRGLVLGSGAAGIDQSMTVTKKSLTRTTRPFSVNPALVPACVMNYAAAQCAIRFDLRGPNTTVTAGRVTGLVALSYAERLLRSNRADLVICGAYEDLNERRVAMARCVDAQSTGGTPSLDEGCCVFLMERASRAARSGRSVLAELVALESGVVTCPGDEHLVLAAVVHRALARAGATGADIAAVAISAADGVPAEDDVLGSELPHAERLRPAADRGDTYGAAAAFQTAAAVLTDLRSAPDPALVLVVATDPDGQVACAILRRNPRHP